MKYTISIFLTVVVSIVDFLINDRVGSSVEFITLCLILCLFLKDYGEKMWVEAKNKPKESGFYVVFTTLNLAETCYFDTSKGWCFVNNENQAVVFWCNEPC